MNDHNCKREYIRASLFTGAVLVLTLVALLFINSCSMAEWRDIAEDAKTRVPNEAVSLVVSDDGSFQVPDKGDLVNSAIALVTGLASGWYGKKFKDKKYAKKESNVA